MAGARSLRRAGAAAICAAPASRSCSRVAGAGVGAGDGARRARRQRHVSRVAHLGLRAGPRRAAHAGADLRRRAAALRARHRAGARHAAALPARRAAPAAPAGAEHRRASRPTCAAAAAGCRASCARRPCTSRPPRSGAPSASCRARRATATARPWRAAARSSPTHRSTSARACGGCTTRPPPSCAAGATPGARAATARAGRTTATPAPRTRSAGRPPTHYNYLLWNLPRTRRGLLPGGGIVEAILRGRDAARALRRPAPHAGVLRSRRRAQRARRLRLRAGPPRDAGRRVVRDLRLGAARLSLPRRALHRDHDRALASRSWITRRARAERRSGWRRVRSPGRSRSPRGC